MTEPCIVAAFIRGSTRFLAKSRLDNQPYEWSTDRKDAHVFASADKAREVSGELGGTVVLAKGAIQPGADGGRRT